MATSTAITLFSGAVAGSGTATVRIATASAEGLLVVWGVTDSAAPSDLGTTTVKPYTPDLNAARADVSRTVLEVLLPATSVAASTRTGTLTTKADRYDVRGVEEVELKLTNAAAGSKNLVVHVYLYG